MVNMQKNTMAGGAMILGTCMIIGKVFGLVYRLILPNMIGPQAMGLYGMAHSVYTILLAISMAGIPVAVSKLISSDIALGDKQGALKTFNVAFWIVTGTGLFFTLILITGAPFIATHITGDPRAYLSLQAVAPAIAAASLMSALRGYFQGLQRMTNTAISQLLEQFIRVLAILIFAYLLLPFGQIYAAAGAAFGNFVGAFIGFLYLLFRYFRTPFVSASLESSNIQDQFLPETTRASDSFLQIMKHILFFSFPIIIGNLVMPVMNLIDATLVVNRLTQAGFSQGQATELFAYLNQYANPIVMFPGTLGMALAMSLVPTISESFARMDMVRLRHKAKLAIRFAVIIGFPSFIGLFFLAEPIVLLIFPNSPGAAVPLTFLAPAVLFLLLKYATTGILQGMSLTMIPVRNFAFGAAFKIMLTLWLTGIEPINIRGAAIGTLLAYFIASMLNLRKVKEKTGLLLSLKNDIGRPLLASGIMGILSLLVFIGFTGLAGERMATLIAVFFGVACYALLVFLLKVLTPQEFTYIPKIGNTVAGLAYKLEEKGIIKKNSE